MYSGEGAGETDTANIKLVEMETRAFDLLRLGRLPEARAVLLSTEYEAQKRIYSQGMTKVATLIKENTNDMLGSEQRKVLFASVTVVVTMPALLIDWLIVLRILHRWRVGLSESNRRLDQQARELLDLNAHLDERVRERTEAAESATRAKSDFLANMSHEIRTPMSGSVSWSSRTTR